MDPIVKQATREDIPAILDITHEAFTKYVADAKVPGKISALYETYEKIEDDLNKKTIFVAQVDKVSIGTIRVEMLQGSIAYISRFGVRLNAHNCGIGKALVSAAIEHAKKSGAKFIALHTASKMTSLIRLYYGFGFFVHSTSIERGYIRALLCLELTDVEEFNADIVKNY